MKYIKSLLILLAASTFFIAGCTKPDIVTQMDVASYSSAMTNLKIVYASAYTTNYSVQLKVNDERVSGNISYSTPFPGGGLNTGGSNVPWYLAIKPGITKIGMSVAKSGTNVDSIPLYNGTLNLGADVYYTAYIADTGVNTMLLMFGENRATPANGTSRFKFINLIPNLPAADLYYNTTKVASNIQYGFGSPDFIQNKSDTTRWTIRAAGALPTSAAIATYPLPGSATQVIPNQRIFTVYSRGYVGLTGNRVPAISLTYN
jgi:hypothetical protein